MSTPETEPGGAAQEVVEAAASPRKGSQWFVIHTYSGYENKVKTNLEKRVNSMGMEDQIFQVLVPVEETLEVKDGKKRTIQRKIFPGYVLVEMTMTDDSWYVVRNTPGVTGFVGSGSKPTPLLPEEVEQIMYQMGLLEARPRPVAKIDVEVGENIRVRSGPFDGFIGVIDEIDAERGKLRVLVSMFGRETPLELDFAQVEKL
jgi:transcriptional antiterminator NusG